MQYDLLSKSELKIRGITLARADLNEIASAVAEVLHLASEEVLVTDYLDRVMTLDVLRKTIDPHRILGRKEALLARLSRVPGVQLGEEATITSEGMLGWIGAAARQAEAAMAAAEGMAGEIGARVGRRVIVFSTGGEVGSGEVKDTNRETIAERLRAEGYSVSFGQTLADDIDLIAGMLRKAASQGYGLILTTGGVGAEHKDCTVEAVLALDPQAETPYICRFEKGRGRHVKDGVRIAVGVFGGMRIIALPGPNAEVRACMDPLVDNLRDDSPKSRFAGSLADTLRGKLRERMIPPV